MASFKSDMTICPFCKEEIAVGAIKCKHCQSNLAPMPGENTVSGPSPATAGNHVISQRSTYVGHGWGTIVISIVFILLAALYGEPESEFYDLEASIGAAILGVIVVVPYGIWIMTREGSNKALPAIAMILSVLSFFGSFMV